MHSPRGSNWGSGALYTLFSGMLGSHLGSRPTTTATAFRLDRAAASIIAAACLSHRDRIG